MKLKLELLGGPLTASAISIKARNPFYASKQIVSQRIASAQLCQLTNFSTQGKGVIIIMLDSYTRQHFS